MIRFQSRLPFRSPLFNLGLLLLISTLSILAAVTARSEEASNKAKNLARMNCGAQIECITPDGHITHVTPLTSQNNVAAALIREDDTVSCSLQEGQTEFVISLPRASLLDRLTFLNENASAAGNLNIAVSNYRLPANSSKWTRVEGTIAFDHKRTFDLSLLGVEAKFVKLSFNVSKSGSIAAVGLYGERSLNEFGARQTNIIQISNDLVARRPNDQLNFNFANTYARARIVKVSSGSLAAAQAMIDDDPATTFRFASDDLHPTVVIELSESQRLHRVSTIYDMQSANLEVYALKNMTGTPEDLTNLTPIASTVDSTGTGKAAVDFNPQGARYVVLRWDLSGHQSKGCFCVAEIHAFGYMPLAFINVEAGPDLLAQNDAGSKLATPDSNISIGSSPGTIAPEIPPVSP